MKIDVARSDWLDLLAVGRPGQRLLDAGQLHCYFGADDHGRAVFFVVSDYQSDAPKLAELVRIEHGRRPDGKWTVVLTLTDGSYTEAFIGMCLEVSRRASAAPDEPAALHVFDATIDQWRRLLSLKGARRLTDREIRGLAAELKFLIERGADSTPRDALEAWVGPHGAPQDFRFGLGQVFELKAVRTGATAIHISSVEQLEVGPGDELTLITIVVNDVPSGMSALNLVSLVNQVRSELGLDDQALQLFEEKLALLQFDVTDEYYYTRCFEFGPRRAFTVSTGFPRLRSEQIPQGAERIKYQLRLAALNGFEIDSLASTSEGVL